MIGGCTGEWQVPVGGMGAVTAALEQAAGAAGAELHTQAEVLALEPDSNGVDVSFSDGVKEHVDPGSERACKRGTGSARAAAGGDQRDELPRAPS